MHMVRSSQLYLDVDDNVIRLDGMADESTVDSFWDEAILMEYAYSSTVFL